jgi:hypothetical protein
MQNLGSSGWGLFVLQRAVREAADSRLRCNWTMPTTPKVEFLEE